MIYTEKIQKAVKFAIKTHEVYQKQKRKGKDIAYIAHPMTAGLILSLAGAKEDVVIAGILHDTIEDSVEVKKVTAEMVEERFGKKVKDLVLSVTEEKEDSHGNPIPWADRKATALAHITHFSQGSVLVKSADVLSNGTELVDDYRKDGAEVFKRFNTTASDTLANYDRVILALLKRWPKSPLTGDLKKLAKEMRLIKN